MGDGLKRATKAAKATKKRAATVKVKRTDVGLVQDEAAMFTAAHEPGDFDEGPPQKRRHLRAVK